MTELVNEILYLFQRLNWLSVVDLVLVTVGLRLLLGQTINLFGHRTSLYTSARKEVA